MEDDGAATSSTTTTTTTTTLNANAFFFLHFNEHDESEEEEPRPHDIKWKPPDTDYFKVNLDGAMFDDTNEAGIGVIIRNNRGEVMASLSEKIQKPSSVTALEFLAARRAVLFAREIDLHKIVLEGDLEFVINSIKSGTNLGCMYGHLIMDILSLVNSSQSVSLSHSYRQGNAATDALAKRTRFFFPLLVWMENVPSNVVQFVSTDFPAQ